VVRTARGYWALEPGAKPVRLEPESGPGLPPEPANVLWRGFFRDFDGDGLSDFLDVSLRGYAITYAGGGRTLLPPEVQESADTEADASSERMVARFGLAAWEQGDFDGDGRSDFAVLTPTGLRIHPGDSRGRVAAGRVFCLALPEAREGDLSFLDINGDGRTDLLAVRRKAGQAVLLIADPRKGLRAPRRMRLAVPGEMRYPVLTDLDGDGRPDLALPYTTKPSVGVAVRVLFRGEVLLQVPIFLNRGGTHPFPRLADRRLSLPIRIRVGSTAEGRIKLSGLVVVEYGGDLDGDGRRDLLVTERTDLLALYPGEPKTVFAEKPARRIPIPDCAAFDQVTSAAARLNADAVSDIILLYRGAGRRPDRLILLLSGKD